jgi:hypothetical protein
MRRQQPGRRPARGSIRPGLGQTQVILPNDPPGHLMGPLPTNGAPGPAAQR